jgi:glutaredoxin
MYSFRKPFAWSLLVAASLFAGCDGKAADPSEEPDAVGETAPQHPPGEAVKPPFAVQGELDGLLIVWFDEQGQHTAKSRSEVPEARRKVVRIDSLAVSPEQRLDGDHVYVADLSKPGADGAYSVQKQTRGWLDSHVQSLLPVEKEPSGDVTLYMASWCGACKAAAKYLESRDVPFVEKDIEKDRAAASEMQSKAQAAGKTPRGVPVIDFRGNILLGFDQRALATLIDQAPAAAKPNPI